MPSDAHAAKCELRVHLHHLQLTAMLPADKLADYEEELKNLRAARDTNTSLQSQQQTSNATRDPSPLQETTAQAITPPAPEAQLPNNPAPPTRPAMPLGRALTTTRLTNFLSARRGAPSPVSPADSTTPPPATDHPNSPMTADLTAQLNTSENARRAAEDKLTKTNAELEELSVSLFSQANEMVAKERIAFADREAQALERENTARDQEKAREQKAKEREVQWQEWQSEMKGRDKAMQLKVKRLEARVKTLEERDKEKGKRLERLESAMNRTIRIRRFLGAHQADCRP